MPQLFWTGRSWYGEHTGVELILDNNTFNVAIGHGWPSRDWLEVRQQIGSGDGRQVIGSSTDFL